MKRIHHQASDVESVHNSFSLSRKFEGSHQFHFFTQTFKLVEPVEQPQSAPPTSNFTTTLAQQRQQALERMEFGASDREDCDMMDEDGGNASDSSSISNPRHPWNVVGAPAMAHQRKHYFA